MKSKQKSQPASWLSRSFLESRREATLILLSWAAFLVWSVGYCAFRGYGRDVDSLETVLGMPDWIFWGVLIPWLAATAFSIWFGIFFMKDDEPADKNDKSADKKLKTSDKKAVRPPTTLEGR